MRISMQACQHIVMVGESSDPEVAMKPAVKEPAPTRAAVTDAVRSTGDGARLRHIICVRCFPSFDGASEAPHDAVCICGKPVRAGDRRPEGSAMPCVVCNELRGHHESERHAVKR